MQEAMFYKKIKKDIQCNLCYRRCLIKEGKTGICRVRKNIKGKLYSLVYGKVNSMAIDPIEKKPFFHFAPGSQCLSIATVGCNFRCSYCCNYVISQEWKKVEGRQMSPEEIVRIAKENGAQGIAYTYTEPTIFFEFAYDIAKIAHKEGLYNVFVTNGYTTPEPIKKISKFLDAAVVDFKASGDKEFYRKFANVPNPELIFQTLKEYKRNKVFIEITNLIAPVNNMHNKNISAGGAPTGKTARGSHPSLRRARASKSMPRLYNENIRIADLSRSYDKIEKQFRSFCKKITETIGSETPLHLIQFFPTYKVKTSPISVKTLEKLYGIAKEAGMKYIYLGNVSNHEHESTFCPECNSMVVRRMGMSVMGFNMKDWKCKKCGKEILAGGKEWSKI